MQRTTWIIVLTVSFFLLLNNKTTGQTWESGFLLGGSNYIGDMAPYPVPDETGFSGGLFLKRNLSPYFSLDFSLNYGRISGNDANYSHLETRNLHFRTDIFEFSTQIEYNFFPFAIGFRNRDRTPFIFTGLSVFHFEPKARLDNEWIELRPLSTEGQGLEDGPDHYSNFALSIPVGLGYRFDAGPKWIFGFKTGFRASMTHYLDDISRDYFDQQLLLEEKGAVSAAMSNPSEGDNALGLHGKQRGNPQQTDWYIFARLVISYRIANPTCFKF